MILPFPAPSHLSFSLFSVIHFQQRVTYITGKSPFCHFHSSFPVEIKLLPRNMTIHSQFWSSKYLENVKLIEIDSLLSCKTQEVPRHDILQGLKSQPFRCARIHTTQRYLQCGSINTFTWLKAITQGDPVYAKKWFTMQVHTMHLLC